jgi:hypothetical protein
MHYPPPQASPLVTFGIAGIALVLAVLFVLAVRAVTPGAARGRATALAALGVSAWLALTFGLAAGGVLARFDSRPPPFVLLLVAIVALAVGLARSRLGARLATGLPLVALVGFQCFRLPLELVMHRAAREGVMPVEMSFGGYNFDVLSGVTAGLLAVVLLGAKGHESSTALRALVVAWNVMGLGFLAVVITVAVAASPLLRAFGDAPEHVNSWVSHAPFVWLPAAMVLAALLGHLLTLRKVLRGAATRPPVAMAPEASSPS